MISQNYLRMLVNSEAQPEELERILSRQKVDIIGEKTLNRIEIEECGEPLVKLVNYIPTALIAMTSKRKRYEDETLYARQSVAEQLSAVAGLVCPYRLKIFDAFRPVEIQQRRFDEISAQVRAKNPGWSEEEVRAETFIFVFPPSWDKRTPPAHSTGGAIDLTLVDVYGTDLDMGTRYGEFDNPLMYTNASGQGLEQRANRELLLTSMAKNGLMNFPGEWWHYSFGDREWIAYLGKLKLPAIFGRADDPYKRSSPRHDVGG